MASSTRVLARFVSGRPLDGRARSNATFWRPGTRALTKSGNVSHWAMLPGYRRLQWRAGAVSASTVLGWGLIFHRYATVVTLCVLAGLAVAAVLAVAVHWWRTWLHHRHWTFPLHKALAAEIGVTDWATEWIHLPRDYADGGPPIRLDLPDHYSPNAATRERIESIVTEKLNLQTPTVEWRMTGRSQHVLIRVATPPPDVVTLADIVKASQGLPDTTLVAGLGQAGVPVYLDLLTDSPHALVSGGSGAGKSVLVRSLTAQALHNGGLVICIDNNRTSQPWLKDLPNAYIARDIARTIHPALVWLGEEMERRAEAADQHSDPDGNLHPDYGPRVWLIAEELNAVTDLLTAHWLTIRSPGTNGASPALAALRRMLYQGRALRMHVIGTAQMATVASLGSPAMRENFAWRALARYTQNQWKMLAPEIWPMPPKSRHRGRWQIVTNGETHETQVPYLTMTEARNHATSGIITYVSASAGIGSGEMAPGTVLSLGQPVFASGGVRSDVVVRRLVGLREACASGVLSLSLDAVRKARSRDGEFPGPADRRGDRPGEEWLYDPDELRAWEANRVRAAAQAAGEGHGEGYDDVHDRLRREFGPAKRHVCGRYGSGGVSQQVGCGGQGAEWGYDYSDPDERRDAAGRNPFSWDTGRYVALCLSCHRRFDAAMRARGRALA
jgi:hypothetical protein